MIFFIKKEVKLMKAAILEGLNKPLLIANVGLTPLLHGQVLVKNLVTGICGAQLEEIKGNKGMRAGKAGRIMIDL